MANAKIYQIYYSPSQVKYLEPPFLPFDNSNRQHRDWCEYDVFRRIYSPSLFANGEYIGFVSWKFRLKTGVSGIDFAQFIEKNPGHNVYFINPYPDERILFRSVWHQGENGHPGLMGFAQDIFDQLGYPIDLRQLVNTNKTFAYCNYWVADQFFWEEYLKFCEPVFNYIEHELTAEESAILEASRVVTNGFSYKPYLMERLFSTFLVQRQEEIRSLRYETQYCLASLPVFDRLRRGPHSMACENTQDDLDRIINTVNLLAGRLAKLREQLAQLELASQFSRHRTLAENLSKLQEDLNDPIVRFALKARQRLAKYPLMRKGLARAIASAWNMYKRTNEKLREPAKLAEDL